MIMVISGRIKKVAFYCRMNHRDKDYTQFLDDVKKTLDENLGEGKWELELFFEVASGADSNRKEFARLKADIKAEKLDAVISMNASMIARDWKQFCEFMELCNKKHVKVFCSKGPDDAEQIYQRIKEFNEKYFGGSSE